MPAYTHLQLPSCVQSDSINYTFKGVEQVKLLDMIGRIIHEDEETSQATVAMIVQLIQGSGVDTDRHMVSRCCWLSRRMLSSSSWSCSALLLTPGMVNVLLWLTSRCYTVLRLTPASGGGV